MFDLTELAEKFDGKSLLLGASGGVDSMVLAFLMRRYFLKSQIHVLIVNHNWREISGFEAELTKKRLLEMGFEKVEILNYIPENFESQLEENARKARHNLIFTYAFENGIEDIFFGHHFDDVLENFFLKLGMSSGIFGFTSLTKEKFFRFNGHFFNIFRPLIECEKKDILLFAKENKIEFAVDETNFDERFKRNRIRKNLELMELSKEAFRLSFKEIEIAGNALKERLKSIFESIVLFDKTYGFFSSDFSLFQSLNFCEQELCLKQMIFYFTEKCEVRRGELKNALALLKAEKGFTLGGLQAFVQQKKIIFIKERSKIIPEIKFGIWDFRFKVKGDLNLQLAPKNASKIRQSLPFFEGSEFEDLKLETVEFKIL